MKYIIAILFAVIIGMSIFGYVKKIQYEAIILQKDKKIVSLENTIVSLKKEVDNSKKEKDRYKHNYNVCLSNNKKNQQLITDLQDKINELNRKYNEVKHNLEETVNKYDEIIKKKDEEIQKLILPDNVTEKTILVNEVINRILETSKGN